MKLLHDSRRGIETRERFFDLFLPFRLRNIGPDNYSATPHPQR